MNVLSLFIRIGFGFTPFIILTQYSDSLLYALCIVCMILAVGFIAYYAGFTYYFSLSIGDSMHPIIPSGIAAVLKTRDTDKIHQGDIITYNLQDVSDYETDPIYISHRVIKRQSESFVTAGDFNRFTDPHMVPKEFVRSKCVFIMTTQQPIYIPLSITAIVVTILYIVQKILSLLKARILVLGTD